MNLFTNQDKFPSQKIAVIGYGYWGQKLAKTLASFNQEVLIVDLALRVKNSDFNQVLFEDVLNDSQIRAVVIATPEITHAQLIKESLLAGKLVLVEKPAATNIGEWNELVKLAKKSQLSLSVDYTFLYSQALVVWKELEIKFSSKLGRLQNLTSIRKSNLDPYKISAKNLPVWWDLAIHDIYIIQDIWQARLGDWRVTTSNPMVSANLNAKFGNVNFQAKYGWRENTERSWRADYEFGQIFWQKTATSENLQVFLAGRQVSDKIIQDTEPSPLDKMISNWLKIIHQKKFDQNYWLAYWKTIGADIKTIQDIDASLT